MNLNEIQTIGSGAGFPIQLETKLDSNGNPILQPNPRYFKWEIINYFPTEKLNKLNNYLGDEYNRKAQEWVEDHSKIPTPTPVPDTQIIYHQLADPGDYYTTNGPKFQTIHQYSYILLAQYSNISRSGLLSGYATIKIIPGIPIKLRFTAFSNGTTGRYLGIKCGDVEVYNKEVHSSHYTEWAGSGTFQEVIIEDPQSDTLILYNDGKGRPYSEWAPIYMGEFTIELADLDYPGRINLIITDFKVPIEDLAVEYKDQLVQYCTDQDMGADIAIPSITVTDEDKYGIVVSYNKTSNYYLIDEKDLPVEMKGIHLTPRKPTTHMGYKYDLGNFFLGCFNIGGDMDAYFQYNNVTGDTTLSNKNLGLNIVTNTPEESTPENNSAYIEGIIWSGTITLEVYSQYGTGKWEGLYLQHQGKKYHVPMHFTTRYSYFYHSVDIEHDKNNPDDKLYFLVDYHEVRNARGFVITRIEFQDSGPSWLVPQVGWYILRGKVELINQNMKALLATQIGQMLRNEYFGTRVWECLEEPNTQALSFLVRRFIKGAIESWEPRLKFLESKLTKQNGLLNIYLRYEVINTQSIESLNFSYNPTTNNINIL